MYWHGINDTYDLALIGMASIAALVLVYNVIALLIEGRRVIRMCKKMRGE